MSKVLMKGNEAIAEAAIRAGCLKIHDEIEKAAQLKITGLIGNANLIDQTSIDTIYNGYQFVSKLSDASGLPLEFITADRELLPAVDIKRIGCPILPIARQLVPPWLKAKDFGK